MIDAAETKKNIEEEHLTIEKDRLEVEEEKMEMKREIHAKLREKLDWEIYVLKLKAEKLKQN
uniref:Uncharacterized protein n=1 Tax=Romanomermis culicivorax TaxID=13658 RepID=A0A915L3V4_ROMCU